MDNDACLLAALDGAGVGLKDTAVAAALLRDDKRRRGYIFTSMANGTKLVRGGRGKSADKQTRPE